MSYAAQTQVPVDRSRAAIEAMLRKAGASRIVHVDEPHEGLVMFMLGGRLIKIVMPVTVGPKGGEQVRRSRWRGLYLIIKAKLEAVEQGVTTVEQEWLAHVVLPDGQTVGQWFEPQLAIAFDKGRMPDHPLMLEGPRG